MTTAPGNSALPENPHYDENHAYRLAGEPAPANRAAGEASVRLLRPALEMMRKNKQFAEKDVRALVAERGCGDDNGLATNSGWSQYERVWFSFHNGMATKTPIRRGSCRRAVGADRAVAASCAAPNRSSRTGPPGPGRARPAAFAARSGAVAAR
ncbi:hypothetical protein [Streptomyces sp. NPDC006875]|uniref:hypothetical protein n=1 Tax=Streptomyces sp. NPDC006875 TaxID=3154781 RepID=UPI003403F4A4